MNSNRLLLAMVVMQGLTVATMWVGQPHFNGTVSAQIPDSGSQQAMMIEELKGIRAEVKAQGARVEKVSGLLEAGKLQVHVVLPDENKRPGK
jgi:ABC-type bacteriocin/lantibiotic exporter with double-glycine peptidase domain